MGEALFVSVEEAARRIGIGRTLANTLCRVFEIAGPIPLAGIGVTPALAVQLDATMVRIWRVPLTMKRPSERSCSFRSVWSEERSRTQSHAPPAGTVLGTAPRPRVSGVSPVAAIRLEVLIG